VTFGRRIGPARVLALAVAAASLECDSVSLAPAGTSAPSAAATLEKPGDLLRSEPMSGAPAGALAWRVLYVSRDEKGRAIRVSGVVVASSLAAPEGGRPVVAWAHPTSGVAEPCAPSRRRDFFDSIPHLRALVTLDYVVAATDYPGLGTRGPHPYLVGASEGRAVLDIVRAAGRLPKAGASTRVAFWGHSQGGQAALFAGELARKYAPELTLFGVAAAAPVTDVARLVRDDAADRGEHVISAYLLASWSRFYGAPLDAFLAGSDIPAVERIAGECVEAGEENYRVPGDRAELPAGFVPEGAFETQPWRQLFEENRAGRTRAGAPLYVAQGTDDLIVRPSITEAFVKDLCARGETVRFERLEGVGHLRAGRASATDAILWMKSRFEGAAAPTSCVAPW
jgi:acetyl esterase/lipase